MIKLIFLIGAITFVKQGMRIYGAKWMERGLGREINTRSDRSRGYREGYELDTNPTLLIY